MADSALPLSACALVLMGEGRAAGPDGAERPVPELLAARAIAAGQLVTIGEAQPSRFGYWLVAPLPQWRQAKVKALVDALTA